MAEVEGEPDAGEGEGPLTFEQLDADGTVLQTRHFGTSNDLGPIGGDAATGDEHAVTADAAFSLRVPALDAARTPAHPPRRRRAARARPPGRRAEPSTSRPPRPAPRSRSART